MATQGNLRGSGKRQTSLRGQCPVDAWARVEQTLRKEGVLATVTADYAANPMEWCFRIGEDVVARGRTMDLLAVAADEWVCRHAGRIAPHRKQPSLARSLGKGFQTNQINHA